MNQNKVLYIVRHAKSSWENESLDDIDRPLKDRGIIDAYTMAGRIKKKTGTPDLIITSPAVRAFHTATIFAGVLDLFEEKFRVNKDLFRADTKKILEIVGNAPDKVNSIIIFGHNPGFTRLANALSNLSLENLPTCGVVKLVFSTDSWKKISKESLVEGSIDFPSENRNAIFGKA